MNKQKQFNRMIDMIDSNLDVFKEVCIDNEIELTKENLKNEIKEYDYEYVVFELTAILYTVKELTDITIEEINELLLKEVNMTYDDLIEIEDSLMF